jgi:hypothetical protein
MTVVNSLVVRDKDTKKLSKIKNENGVQGGCGKSTPLTEVDVFENAKLFGFRENRAVRFIGWLGEAIFPYPTNSSHLKSA